MLKLWDMPCTGKDRTVYAVSVSAEKRYAQTPSSSTDGRAACCCGAELGACELADGDPGRFGCELSTGDGLKALVPNGANGALLRLDDPRHSCQIVGGVFSCMVIFVYSPAASSLQKPVDAQYAEHRLLSLLSHPPSSQSWDSQNWFKSSSWKAAASLHFCIHERWHVRV